MLTITARWGIKVAAALLAVIGLILVLLFSMLYTNAGLQLAVWGAEKVLPQLRVGEARGAILSQLSLKNISFEEQKFNLLVSSDHLELDIDSSCFLSVMVCVENIAVEGVNVSFPTLPAMKTEEKTASEPITEITLPIAVKVNQIELNSIELDILGHRADWDSFSSKLEMRGNKLTVHPTLWQNLNYTPAAASSNKEQPPAEKPRKGDITLPDVWIPLDIELEIFELNQFHLQGSSPVTVNHLRLSAQAHQDDISISSFELDTPQGDLSLQAETELSGDYPIQLTAEAEIKQTELKGQALSLEVSGSVANLDARVQLKKIIQADIEAQLKPLEASLPFRFSLRNGKGQWPLSSDAAYQANIEALELYGSLEGYNLTLSALLDGETIPELDVKLNGKGDLNGVSLQSIQLNTLGGEIEGWVKAHWKQPIRWETELTLTDIQPGSEWQQAEGRVSGSLYSSGSLTEDGGWEMTLPRLDITGMVRGYPLNMKGGLSASDPKGDGRISIATQGLSLQHGSNGVHLSGKLAEQWMLDAEINTLALEKSIPDSEGVIKGQIHIRGERQQPHISTKAQAARLAYKSLGSINQLTLDSTLSLMPQIEGEINLKVQDALYQGKRIDTASVSLSGTQELHDFKLDLDSELVKTDIDISGRVHKQPSINWQGTMDKATIQTKQGAWQLNHSLALAFDIEQSQLSLAAHCWMQASSSLCLEQDTKLGKSGEVSLAIKDFSFRQLSMFLPKETQLKGEINAKANASWGEEEKPKADFHVSFAQGELVQTLEKPVTLGWDAIVVNAKLNKDRLIADLDANLTNNGSLKGSLNVKNVKKFQQNLDARIALNDLNLAMFQPLVGEYSKIGAAVNSDISLSGAVRHPKVHGRFVMSELLATGDVAPIEVESGQIRVDFSGYDAILKADIDTPDGVLQLGGEASWKTLKAWQAKLNVFAKELDVSVPPLVKVKVKPDMQIVVTPEKAKIAGDIYLPWGRITVEELPSNAVEVSSDEVILNKYLQKQERVTPLPMAVETNVNVHIGDDFKLLAFGLRGGLIGKLNVTQKDKGPFIVGEVEINKGVYRSFGQDLIIKKGQVLMNGPVDQPYLAVEAVRNPDNTQDGVVAGIRVTGPANEPLIEVFSVPAMSQQNALSYLLRGQGLGSSTGGNAMTTALIGLSLAKSGRLVGQIGERFGLSDVQLDTAGSGNESQVTVSGYLTPDLQLKYGVGIFDSFGEFTVRYKLVTDLYLEAVSGMNSAVDLLYQFEFD